MVQLTVLTALVVTAAAMLLRGRSVLRGAARSEPQLGALDIAALHGGAQLVVAVALTLMRSRRLGPGETHHEDLTCAIADVAPERAAPLPRIEGLLASTEVQHELALLFDRLYRLGLLVRPTCRRRLIAAAAVTELATLGGVSLVTAALIDGSNAAYTVAAGAETVALQVMAFGFLALLRARGRVGLATVQRLREQSPHLAPCQVATYGSHGPLALALAVALHGTPVLWLVPGDFARAIGAVGAPAAGPAVTIRTADAPWPSNAAGRSVVDSGAEPGHTLSASR